VTTETPEENIRATGNIVRVSWDIKAPAAHGTRAAAALIEHNVPLSAITANETPLGKIQNVSNNRCVKKEHTWLWTSSCTTSTSPSTPGCAGTGDPRGPLTLLAVPPAVHFFTVFLAMEI
jgi:hypothetical protein